MAVNHPFVWTMFFFGGGGIGTVPTDFHNRICICFFVVASGGSGKGRPLFFEDGWYILPYRCILLISPKSRY